MCPRRARRQVQQGFLDSNGITGIEVILGGMTLFMPEAFTFFVWCSTMSKFRYTAVWRSPQRALLKTPHLNNR